MVRKLLARRAIALAVAYALALQALFQVLAVAGPAADDSLCASLSHETGDESGAPPRSGHDCPLCPLFCGGGAAAVFGPVAGPNVWPAGSAALAVAGSAAPCGVVVIKAGWPRAPPA